MKIFCLHPRRQGNTPPAERVTRTRTERADASAYKVWLLGRDRKGALTTR